MPRLLLGLVEGEQRPVLADGLPSGGAGLPVPVLDDVALHAGRLHPDAEAGKLDIPDDVVLGARSDSRLMVLVSFCLAMGFARSG